VTEGDRSGAGQPAPSRTADRSGAGQPAPSRTAERRPARGYLLAATGAALFSLNGIWARYLLDDGLDAARLSQLRSAGSWLLLLAALAIARPDLLRVDRDLLPGLALLGVVGLAGVHATYFLAIDRLEIGPAVTIQYLAPLLLLVWLRTVHGRRIAPSLWGAVALSLAGCFLVVRAYDAGDLDTVGVVAAFASTITFAIYMVGSERAGHRLQPVTTLFWVFGFATVFWALPTPWWSFPWDGLDSLRNVLLGTGLIVAGTLLPFICIVASLRHIPAPRAAVVATLEPALAAVFAWIVLGEELAAVQIAGGVVVLTAVAWVQSRRPDLEAEGAPPSRSGARFSPR
jgi:drug/metabolite transporter (DMT)-like permease